MSDPFHRPARGASRRDLLRMLPGGMGLAALASLGAPRQALASVARPPATLPHFAPKAKRIIYLCQSGGPSHMDLWDYKPTLFAKHGDDLPPTVMGDQRITGMTSGQSRFRVAQPIAPFRQHGECGRWVSDLLPHTAKVVDEICVIKSMHTEAINHDPGITFLTTGTQQNGAASLGAWLSYGLGSENADFPAFLVLLSQGNGKNPGQPIFSRLWGSGYLPSKHQGVRLRSGADPVLYLNDTPGVDRETRRRMLDDLDSLNTQRRGVTNDPEIDTWIAQHEMAFRMQASVPDLVDLSDESDHTYRLYGEDARKPGTYAANCLLARRLCERGVRCVQLFHRGWDQHTKLDKDLRAQCRDTDQASAALITDLRRRGLLDETLVVWCGEFGRTAYSQGALGSGRDHHGRCFSMWMAGGGIKPGVEYGETDAFGYNVAADQVEVRDLNATLLHCLGIDSRRFSYLYQGLEQRLTGVEPSRVVTEVLA
ncbi:MAG: DUF1501 domain-containing protein [Planctomycetota bacterium]